MNNLDLLIRENKKKRKFEDYSRQLSNILNIRLVQNDFLSLEQTELLTSKFYKSYKEANKKDCNKYSLNEQSELKQVLKSISFKVNNKKSFLIIRQTETCGLLKVSTAEVLEKYEQIIQLDGDSLCLLLEDESKGIYLDYFEEITEQGSAWFYEICFWKL